MKLLNLGFGKFFFIIKWRIDWRGIDGLYLGDSIEDGEKGMILRGILEVELRGFDSLDVRVERIGKIKDDF